MGHSLTTALETETLADQLMPAIFVEIDTPDGNSYMWTGVGPKSWSGQTWLGTGELGGVSAVTETTDLQAQGVTFSLNGFDATLIDKAINSVARFYPAKAWLGALDGNLSVIADPYQFHNGLVDSSSVATDGRTASIQVTSESRLIAMQQPRERRYTDQDQRIECPGDGGFKFVDFLQNLVTQWGATSINPQSTTAGIPGFLARFGRGY